MKKNYDNNPEPGEMNMLAGIQQSAEKHIAEEELVDDDIERRKKLFQFLMNMLKAEE